MNVTFETKYKAVAGKDEWLTPRYITDALGPFDLDPCSPVKRPWDTAKVHYTIEDNGLSSDMDWFGMVWCNPPNGNQTGLWLRRCAAHKDCIALTFARTETKMFFDFVWARAYSVLFLRGRIAFHNVDGSTKWNAGAPSVLIAYSLRAGERLKNSGLKGKYIVL